MKIIQILAGQEDESHLLYGLGDDGALYEFHYAMEPIKRLVSAVAKTKRMAVDDLVEPPPVQVRYNDGSTLGWKLLCPSGQMAKPVPHAEDPTRCERC